jgi:hypothetical protein
MTTSGYSAKMYSISAASSVVTQCAPWRVPCWYACRDSAHASNPPQPQMRSLTTELQQPNSDEWSFNIAQETTHIFYVLFAAVEQFHKTYNRYPGLYSSDVRAAACSPPLHAPLGSRSPHGAACSARVHASACVCASVRLRLRACMCLCACVRARLRLRACMRPCACSCACGSRGQAADHMDLMCLSAARRRHVQAERDRLASAFVTRTRQLPSPPCEIAVPCNLSRAPCSPLRAPIGSDRSCRDAESRLWAAHNLEKAVSYRESLGRRCWPEAVGISSPSQG